MKVQCDVCKQAPAVLLCCADDAALCDCCDTQVHAANKLAGRHERIPLIGHEPSTCDICQEKSGLFFCLEDRALLCRDCDVSIHTANNLASKHKRFLINGVRVGLEALIAESPLLLRPPPPPLGVARMGLEALVSVSPPPPPPRAVRVGLEALVVESPPPPPPAPPPCQAPIRAVEVMKSANSTGSTHNLGMSCLPPIGQFECLPLLFNPSSSSSALSSTDLSDCLAQLDELLSLPMASFPTTSFTPPDQLITISLEELGSHNRPVGLNMLHASPTLLDDSNFAKVPSTPSPSLLQDQQRKRFIVGDESTYSMYDHPILVPTSILPPCKQSRTSLYGNAIRG